MQTNHQLDKTDTPLIFTDLDGTLLDHDTYSFAPAKAMLTKLQRHNIVVIPNTSKTRAEVLKIRTAMALSGPFIVENGAAVYIPKACLTSQPQDSECDGEYWLKSFAPPRSQWLAMLDSLQAQYGDLFRHFATMTLEQVCQATGLSAQDAQLAMQREFGEPIEWLGTDVQKAHFIEALKQLGANPVEGGRFMHLKGDTDKGAAMQWLLAQYQQQFSQRHWVSVALGDGQNDALMLACADFPVRILSPVNPLPLFSTDKNIITSTLPGPAGWAECLETLLVM